MTESAASAATGPELSTIVSSSFETSPRLMLVNSRRNGRLMEDLFEGSTINTPSMLCLEDYLSALAFVDSVGGLEGTIARSDANAKVIADWVARTPWVDFVARVPETRSNTSA